MEERKTEAAADKGGVYAVIDERDLLLDLKVLMKEYYIGSFEGDGSVLKIALSNGQRFELICRAAD